MKQVFSQSSSVISRNIKLHSLKNSLQFESKFFIIKSSSFVVNVEQTFVRMALEAINFCG